MLLRESLVINRDVLRDEFRILNCSKGFCTVDLCFEIAIRCKYDVQWREECENMVAGVSDHYGSSGQVQLIILILCCKETPPPIVRGTWFNYDQVPMVATMTG